ncbi:ATP-binding protein [Tetragenococcus halophilus]|uniref:sensor histidine kinase n=1 Tax=Tetragenococcus halophilus TaxID=51669 RepID=UPI001F2CDE9B|nr:ATP-binding protein [Tetragenococcus halophilus]MCF1685831.1 ATP-binding protein [Tetragenococcus halophilus]
MRSDINRIKVIVNELMSNAVNSYATDIDVNVSRSEDKITIKVVDNGEGMDKETLEKARKKLNHSYRKDFEEYYGQLAGKQTSHGGLSIVGMQVNEAEIESTEGEGTTVIVRKKR